MYKPKKPKTNVKKIIEEKKDLPPIDKKSLLKSDILKQTSILDYFEKKNNNKKQKIFT